MVRRGRAWRRITRRWPTTAIVWFRRDLRVHDHPALTAAARSADRVVPVFVLDDALLRGRFESGPRAALPARLPARAARGAARPRRRPRRPPRRTRSASWPRWRGRRARARSTSPPTCRRFAMARDRRVEAALARRASRSCAIPGCSSPTSASRAPRAASRSPSSRRSGARGTQLDRREVHGAPRKLALPGGRAVGRDPVGRRARAARTTCRTRSRPARRPARARMHAWLRDGIARLRRPPRPARGRHLGALAVPALRLRLPARARAARPRRRRRRGPAEFVRQLCWRDFYAHVLLNQPAATRATPTSARMDELEWEDDDEAFEAWCEGRTGLPGRRRRDAPAARARLDAQPRAADRRARS